MTGASGFRFQSFMYLQISLQIESQLSALRGRIDSSAASYFAHGCESCLEIMLNFCNSCCKSIKSLETRNTRINSKLNNQSWEFPNTDFCEFWLTDRAAERQYLPRCHLTNKAGTKVARRCLWPFFLLQHFAGQYAVRVLLRTNLSPTSDHYLCLGKIKAKKATQ